MTESNPALAKPSDLAARRAGPVAPEARGGDATAVAPERVLPSPMRFDLNGGELVELVEDQVFADRVVVRAGERGVTLFPSSQAAAWVVRFPRVGRKERVIPERLLRVID